MAESRFDSHKQKRCNYWDNNGECLKGDSCQYYHAELCNHYKNFGTCKHNPCKYHHVKNPTHRGEKLNHFKNNKDNQEICSLKKQNEKLQREVEKMKQDAEKKEKEEIRKKIKEQDREIA